MNYERVYSEIIAFRQRQLPDEAVYSELHHIVPRSLGGSDSKLNLVRLTAREHFICHFLLTKLYERGSVEFFKMHTAFNHMAAGAKSKRRYMNSRLYASARGDFSAAMSYNQMAEKNSQHGTFWVTDGKTNRKIAANDPVPLGFVVGRRVQSRKVPDLRKGISFCRLCSFEPVARQWWNRFVASDSESMSDFVRTSEYPYSLVAFRGMLTRHIKEYKPEPGKRYRLRVPELRKQVCLSMLPAFEAGQG